MAEPLLKVLNVSKSFGGLRVLDRVSLSVGRGSLTLLIGPNGSGKTTLLNIITGVLKPDAGKVLFKGLDITHLKPHERFRLGVVRAFQTPRLFTSLSVAENLLVPLRDYSEERILSMLIGGSWVAREALAARDAQRLLNLAKLEDKWSTRASELSGGQSKLLECTRAVMSDPELLLLDEPLASVNYAVAREIMKRLVELKEAGVGLLVVEHRLDLAMEYADHVYVLHQGRVISEGSPHEVVNDPRVLEAYLGGAGCYS
uniref:Probable branched-chain amino acid transport ATP-binding protein LivG n=1 Tax=Thermofilum pendens TaxID=2269 RepID=A0A7C1T0R0_THEPE